MAATWLDPTLTLANRKAKEQLGWSPRFASYKQGIDDLISRL